MFHPAKQSLVRSSRKYIRLLGAANEYSFDWPFQGRTLSLNVEGFGLLFAVSAQATKHKLKRIRKNVFIFYLLFYADRLIITATIGVAILFSFTLEAAGTSERIFWTARLSGITVRATVLAIASVFQ